jgi:UPF0755 protein
MDDQRLEAEGADGERLADGLPTQPGGAAAGRPVGGGFERPLLLLALLFGLVIAAGGAWIVTGRLLEGSSSAGSGLRAWWLARQTERLLAPSATDDAPRVFTIEPGEALAQVADRLQAEGLLRDAAAFRLLARVRGLDTTIQAGRHELRPIMDAEAVLAALQSAAGDQLTVAIPEGRRLEETVAVLSQAGLGSTETFERLLAELDLSAWPLIAARPSGATLEGYLFPDTYQFDPDGGEEATLRRLLDGFNAQLTPQRQALVAASGRSLHELVILASIVEREAVLETERARIARVYLNRLAEPPFILNADPTIQYALGFQPDANSWWKRPLYLEDLQIDSPYNSYTRGGLPPGPICSPGIASLDAVLAPEDGDWMYFVANDEACDGSHVFGRTLEEHNANVARYQTGGCG